MHLDGWSEQPSSEWIVVRMKRPDERSPVDVLESPVARHADGAPHVFDVVVGQRHHEPGHHAVQQAADVVPRQVVGRVDGLRDRALRRHVRRRMRT